MHAVRGEWEAGKGGESTGNEEQCDDIRRKCWNYNFELYTPEREKGRGVGEEGD